MNLAQALKIPGASVDRLHRLLQRRGTDVDRLWACPQKLLPSADPWQLEILSDPLHNHCICASRQSGKTTVVAAQVVWELQTCGSFVLVVSASEDQAFEFMERVYQCYDQMPLVGLAEPRCKSQMRLANGGRVLGLPCNERTVRVYSSVDRLVVDEASRVPDGLYAAVRPMLAVSGGRQTILSTPYGKRGFFYSITTGTSGNWRRTLVPWRLCPRITPQFIQEEIDECGQLFVEQEYECSFVATDSGLFDPEDFAELIDESVETICW